MSTRAPSPATGVRGAGGDGVSYYGELAVGGGGGDGWGGGISVAAGSLEIHQSSIFDNAAFGGGGGRGYYNGDTTITAGLPGVGAGGGLRISSNFPLADLDTFTESNTINNRADINPNISGPYSLNGTWVVPLAVSDVSTLEGNAGTTAFVFTVRLWAPSNQAVSVNYATADGTATAGSDYQAASGTLTIPAGQTSGTITVWVNGDRLAEASETFAVNLSAPTNATIADGTGVGTIVDDEPRISIGDTPVTEGNAGSTSATFTVTLSAAYDVNVTVNYSTADGTATAGSDYQAASGTLTFAPGEISKTVTVQVIGDRLAEANEAFFINLSSPTNAVITDGQGVGTVVDDEPHIGIGTVTKAEGRKNHTTSFTFTVTLSAAYDQAVTVSFRTVDGTATTSDGDYVGKTRTLTFAPGETTKIITIEVKGDSKKEADEYFFLELFGNSSNSLFTKNRGLGTILNDD
jgi:large repetitive protein